MTDTISISICGCGAVGSQVALFIAQPNMRFVLIDDDRIEEDNIFTTAYSRQHVGAYKAQVLGELLYRKSGCISEIYTRTLERGRFTFPCDLVLDCFDNVDARALTRSSHTLHIGVSQERTGAVTWDKDYTLPEGLPRGEEQFCTHQVGRRIIRFTAAVAANIVETFLATGRQESVIITEERIIPYA